MNTGRVIEAKHKVKPALITDATIASALDNLSANDMSQSALSSNREGAIRKISGCVVVPIDQVQLPVTQARVELYQSASPQAVVGELDGDVLAHLRYCLLERFQQIWLYSDNGYVADAPLTDFADIEQLHKIPGFELVVAAARSQTNSSFAQLLHNNPKILQTLLCYYHPNRLPAFCVATTTTDASGFFRFEVDEQGYSHTRPGYYFVVRRLLSSNLFVTLYNPMPAAWYTHWEPSSKLITLRTRHPSALKAHN